MRLVVLAALGRQPDELGREVEFRPLQAADGARVVRQVDNMPGFSGLPMTRADVERKFRSNVGTRWPQQRTDVALQALGALDRADNLSVLLSKFAVQT
jgi:2-methylcitrate dehydratase